MKTPSWLEKLASFSRRDRDALVLLLLVFIGCVVIFPFLGSNVPHGKPYFNSFTYKRDTTKKGARGRYYTPRNIRYSQKDEGFGDGSRAVSPTERLVITPFPFDPNTADSTQLLRLGLAPWQVRAIYRYRARGGYFYAPSDFARLHGLTLRQYKVLEPYIRIKKEPLAADVIAREKRYKPSIASYRPSTTSYEPATKPLSQPQPTYPRQEKLAEGQTIDINTADTTALKKVPGIGSYLARRIVELRKRCGVFLSTDELLVINQIPEYSLLYMTASAKVPKIRINTATEQELQAHPLLNRKQAADIIRLRSNSGPIRSAENLSFVPSFSPRQLFRITPFLVFD